MNRTKIDTCDLSWNPYTGCEHECWYCYAKRGYERFHRSFKPTFHPNRLHEIGTLRQPTPEQNAKRKPWIVRVFPDKWLVFACSVADIFASWTPLEWAGEVVSRAITADSEHVIFQFLTKSPEGIKQKFGQHLDAHRIAAWFPSNFWIGATVTQQSEVNKIRVLVDSVENAKVFGSFEPLLGFIDIPEDLLESLDWMIVGKLTGSRRVKLQQEWVDDLFLQSDLYDVPLFIKDSVVKELGPKYRIQEFPT